MGGAVLIVTGWAFVCSGRIFVCGGGLRGVFVRAEVEPAGSFALAGTGTCLRGAAPGCGLPDCHQTQAATKSNNSAPTQ